MRITYLIIIVFSILILSSNAAKSQLSILYPTSTDTIFAGDKLEFIIRNTLDVDYDLYYFDDDLNDWQWVDADYDNTRAYWTVPQLKTPLVRFKVESNYIKSPWIKWDPGTTNSSEVKSVDFSADDKLVLTSAKDGTAQIWEVSTKNKIDSMDLGSGINISDAIFHHNEDTVFLAGSSVNNYIYLWDRISNTSEILTAANDLVRSLHLHPTRNIIAAASYDGFIRILEIPSGNVIRSYDLSATAPCRIVRFSHDGEKIVFGDEESNIYVMDWETETTAQVFEKHTTSSALKPIWYAEFSQDDKMISTGGVDYKAKIWDISTQSEIYDNTYSTQIRAALFNPVRNDFFAASIDGEIVQFDLTTGNQIHAVVTDPNQIISAKFSSDGNYFLTGGRGNKFLLWHNWMKIDLEDSVTTNFRYKIYVSIPDAQTVPGDYLPLDVILTNPIDDMNFITSELNLEYKIEYPRAAYSLNTYDGILTRGVWFDTLSFTSKTFLKDNELLTSTVGLILSSMNAIDSVKIIDVSIPNEEVYSFYLKHCELRIIYDCTNSDVNGIIFDKITSINIRPNPASDHATIRLNVIADSKYVLNLLNNRGDLVVEIANMDFKHGFHDFFIDLKNLTSGVYTIQLISNVDVKYSQFIISK